jgi:hypothetical protein
MPNGEKRFLGANPEQQTALTDALAFLGLNFIAWGFCIAGWIIAVWFWHWLP